MLRRNDHGALILRVNGEIRRARFNARNHQFFYEIDAAHDGHVELESLILLQKLVGNNGVFYDIGANWGYYSHAIAAQNNFSGQVIAFEPHPQAFNDLKSLSAQFGLNQKEILLNAALDAKEEAGKLYFKRAFDTATARLSEKGSKGSVAIQIKTLDGLGLAPPSVMKIDVEGHELGVLHGGEKLIAKHRPFILMENNPSPQAIAGSLPPLQYLANKDYVFFLPLWEEESGLLTADSNAISDDAYAKLVLWPVTIYDRFIYPPLCINVLGAPREKLDWLKSRLEQT